ncbi:AAA family ATPase [Actinomadura syzygii]|uniref:AAA family ATPase n=1 Tax=Actinomadura syzygii TaxID=1427538 RepID=A0A5D0TT84_9ACTN|nr:AAA family ATPase [Actinomadura syzygii]TYC08556.1 AAA family ATPase [Actinomadura syzygii]
MPASTIVASSGQIRLFDTSVQTFDLLPVATYAIDFSQTAGYSLRQVEPLAPGGETVYGTHAERVTRIMRGYEAMDRSLGVILSGGKGMGKSLMIRMLAERARDDLGLPTVLVQRSTPGLASFLDELGEALVVFDEFEKAFAAGDEVEPQNQFLGLFDGLSATKRLYALSVNELGRVHDAMLNRPGRFHYHMRFAYPGPEAVGQYLHNQVPGITGTQIEEIVDFSRKYDINYDHLRAIAFEMRLGESFGDAIGDLNIKRTGRRGKDPVQARITWTDGDTDEISGEIDLFDLDARQSIEDWDLDIELRFRMRDACPSEGGYVLPADAFEIVDNRTEEQKAEAGDEDTKPLDLRAASVVLHRPHTYSIDF